eukprot:TRINITY_DN1317_c0_g2_i12.p1 TRINITY_DN1317_c0_g2~~TRINITY_DN1317_c0_g2_i12.p1  ORF type:complete len:258 (+),score=38.05 TRINITY_DN1317_c0_g2_i12:188-961(+)
MNQKNNTSAFLYSFKRIPFPIQSLPKCTNVEEGARGDFDEVQTYYQPTCYGNFGTAFFKDSSYIPNRARANCTHQMLKTAGRFFPSRNFQGVNASFVAQRKESPLNCYPTLKQRLREGLQAKNPNAARMTCYSLCSKMGPKAKHSEKRPMTGSVNKYKLNNEASAASNENCANKLRNRRAKTAQGCDDLAGFKYVSHRMSTPQTVLQKRPGSRYNKASLYSGLENGRKSPEYKVPIIEMNLKDYAYHNSVMPSFWKE